MSEDKEPSSETRSAGQGQLNDFKTKLNTSYWSALRNCLLELWENIWQFEDEYKLVSQMSAEEFSVWASAHEDFVKQFLDDQSDIDDIREDSKEAGERIASLWAKCPTPFRIIFSEDDPDKVVYSPIDFPPDLDRVIRELHEKYPSCDWNEPFLLDCIAILHYAQKDLQQIFLPMLEQLTAGKDVSSDWRNFHYFIHNIRCWLDHYNALNDVCRIHSEMKVLSDAIAEMERVNANTTTLEKMKNDLQQNLNAMMETNASLARTNASLARANASLQRQTNKTLPQILQTVTDEGKKTRDAGRRAKDEILVEIAAQVKGRGGAGNGIKGMTVKNFVTNFRIVFENKRESYHVNQMPDVDEKGDKAHDPIENNLRKILNEEDDGKDDKKKKYTPYQKKNKRKPFYWEISDLVEALSTHCVDRGYTFENMAGEECHGIGELREEVFDYAVNNSGDIVNLSDGNYFPKTSAVQDETDDGDDEE